MKHIYHNSRLKSGTQLLIYVLFLIFGCNGKKSINYDQNSNADKDIQSEKEDILTAKTDIDEKIDTVLSPASLLMIKACDNYLAVNDSGQKSAEVMNIKATLLYNRRLFELSRTIYNQILVKFPKTTFSSDAMQMIAQSYYEEKRFNEAQIWYRKLSNEVESTPDKEDAIKRVAESIFRMAEAYEEKKNYKEAVVEYERVALEFPESNIADVALFNAGLGYEKMIDWTHAILVFQRLIQKYSNSQLLAKAQFRIAKNHEKMHQWDYAAEAYLKVVVEYKSSELGPLAMYNAGFCFESAEKLREAAATFEKLAFLYPSAPDAPDVLFKAGEIYGKIKDWQSVTRVNQTFTEKYGNDEDRIIQALCMVGIALYMQNKEVDAIKQLEKAVITFGKLKQVSNVNTYYTAKALFTIGEIYHAQMNRVELGALKSVYKKQLEQKSFILDKAIESYTRVIKFSISEWTTRSVFQIGQAYEDFGIGIFKQQRPTFNSYDDRMALELGIAQAVEQYFMEKSIYYHELNVKLGIKEKLEDKFITQSRQKLTYLPYLAGENYIALVEITKNAQGNVSLQGFSSIAKTLQMLQKIAPFQEKAIELFLKCLELGSKYGEINEFYSKAASNITGHSFMVGQTYDKVVTIARDAPIPENFNEYEKFIYKTKLLKQIENYEDLALTNYLKTLKIADAYKIADKSVKESQIHIARLLFNKAWCYDLLSANAFEKPPYPVSISEEEMEEFKKSFTEIGIKFQAQAVEIYKTVMEFEKQKYASGEFVSHSYMRLFQLFPEIFGVPDSVISIKTVSIDSMWTYSTDYLQQWSEPGFNDSGWAIAEVFMETDSSVTGFPNLFPAKINHNFNNNKEIQKIYFRKKFDAENPSISNLFIAVNGNASVYLNGKKLPIDSAMYNDKKAFKYEIKKINNGSNSLAVEVKRTSKSNVVLYMVLCIQERKKVMRPKPLGVDKSLTAGFEDKKYKYPFVKNFSDENGR